MSLRGPVESVDAARGLEQLHETMPNQADKAMTKTKSDEMEVIAALLKKVQRLKSQLRNAAVIIKNLSEEKQTLIDINNELSYKIRKKKNAQKFQHKNEQTNRSENDPKIVSDTEVSDTSSISSSSDADESLQMIWNIFQDNPDDKTNLHSNGPMVNESSVHDDDAELFIKSAKMNLHNKKRSTTSNAQQSHVNPALFTKKLPLD